MKILAFTDLHEDYGFVDELEKKAKYVDLIICAGDITVFGDNLEQALNFLDRFQKKVLIIHGNHESEAKLKRLCLKTKHVKFIHKNFYKINDLVIMAHGGGGFVREDEDFKEVEELFSLLVKENKRSILMTHAPPYRTKLDELRKNYFVGSRTYRRFIEKNQPTVAVSGHIHETFKAIDKIGRTILVNPGPAGAIIEL